MIIDARRLINVMVLASILMVALAGNENTWPAAHLPLIQNVALASVRS
jgi:hypothetical protein